MLVGRSMDYRYTYTASLHSSWCRRNWTPYLRRDGINGCPSPPLLLSSLKLITTQNITLRIHAPLHMPPLLFPPSPLIHKHTHAHLKHNIHHRPLHRLLLIPLETPTSPPRSLPPRNGKLPRNARHGRRRQLAFVLSYRLGVDQGNVSPSLPSFARRLFNMNGKNAGLVRRRHPKQDICPRQRLRSNATYPHRRTESPQGVWRRAGVDVRG